MTAPTVTRVLSRGATAKHWRDATRVVREVKWVRARLTLVLDAQRVREQHFSSAVRDGDWRIEWAHWQAPALEGAARRSEYSGDTVTVTLADVREAA